LRDARAGLAMFGLGAPLPADPPMTDASG
jgi:hypothetical protein